MTGQEITIVHPFPCLAWERWRYFFRFFPAWKHPLAIIGGRKWTLVRVCGANIQKHVWTFGIERFGKCVIARFPDLVSAKWDWTFCQCEFKMHRESSHCKYFFSIGNHNFFPSHSQSRKRWPTLRTIWYWLQIGKCFEGQASKNKLGTLWERADV